MPHPILTKNEVIRLVEAVIEDSNDRSLSYTEFTEMVGLLCEGIPGQEFLAEEDLRQISDSGWPIYEQMLHTKIKET